MSYYISDQKKAGQKKQRKRRSARHTGSPPWTSKCLRKGGGVHLEPTLAIGGEVCPVRARRMPGALPLY